MLKEIDSYDAKTKLPEILRRVAAGESFTITNRGKPIADVMPNRSINRSRAKVAIDNILAAKKHPTSDQDLTELRNEGRR